MWQRAPKLGVQICKSRCLQRARNYITPSNYKLLVNQCHWDTVGQLMFRYNGSRVQVLTNCNRCCRDWTETKVFLKQNPFWFVFQKYFYGYGENVWTVYLMVPSPDLVVDSLSTVCRTPWMFHPCLKKSTNLEIIWRNKNKTKQWNDPEEPRNLWRTALEPVTVLLRQWEGCLSQSRKNTERPK